jgi:hypothetical protein
VAGRADKGRPPGNGGLTDGASIPGDGVIIEGAKIKITPDHTDAIGLFFIGSAGPAYKVTLRLTHNTLS